MTSFYPGPSRVYDEIPGWVADAFDKGILSMNHRSPEFIALTRKTVGLLKKKLKIPEDYTVFFTSSATECWEIIAQSLVVSKSIHIHNGSFGEKWCDYTRRLRPEALSVAFGANQVLNPKDHVYGEGELICLTQNETSNGTQLANKIIRTLAKNNPGHLVAVDATSSMGGVELEFESADVWFASVQKCFGMPAGLAVLVCSPRAMSRMDKIQEKSHYNSLTQLASMMEKWQTPCTPNVLGIYLLSRVLKKMERIEVVARKIEDRHKAWVRFFKKGRALRLLAEDPGIRSKTVMAIKGSPDLVSMVKTVARKKGLILGEGYGTLRNETFRIANFPAIKRKEITRLMRFLKAYR